VQGANNKLWFGSTVMDKISIADLVSCVNGNNDRADESPVVRSLVGIFESQTTIKTHPLH
jgi:hypothetical protein